MAEVFVQLTTNSHDLISMSIDISIQTFHRSVSIVTLLLLASTALTLIFKSSQTQNLNGFQKSPFCRALATGKSKANCAETFKQVIRPCQLIIAST